MLIHQPFLAFLVALTPVTCSVLKTRQSAPADDLVKISRVTTSGNGCLQGSVPFNTYPNQTVIFQRLTEFHVSLGPNIAAAEGTKNCAFHFEITYPTGWQFLLQQSSYGGFARLDKGIGGHFIAQYYLSSAPSNSFITRADTAGDNFLTGTEFVLDQSSVNSPDLWSRCTGKDTAHFSNHLSLERTGSASPGASGELWGNGAMTQTISAMWRRC